MSRDKCLAAGGAREGDEDTHGGGFACTVRPDKTINRSSGHIQAHAAQSLKIIEGFDEIVCFNNVVGHEHLV